MSADTAVATTLNAKPGLKIPAHLAVIMDGNGRWAKARGKVRTEGHVEGVKALRRLVDLSIRYGVKHLTVFSFSSENWSRPRDEVNFIFGLLHRFVASDLATLIQNNVRVRIIGTRHRPRRSAEAADRRGAGQDRPQYRARADRRLQLWRQIRTHRGDESDRRRRWRPASCASRTSPKRRSRGRSTPPARPDPDLIIRTSGEQRGFELPASGRAPIPELVFVEENWPDFSEQVFLQGARRIFLAQPTLWRDRVEEPVSAPEDQRPQFNPLARRSWTDLGPRFASAIVLLHHGRRGPLFRLLRLRRAGRRRVRRLLSRVGTDGDAEATDRRRRCADRPAGHCRTDLSRARPLASLGAAAAAAVVAAFGSPGSRLWRIGGVVFYGIVIIALLLIRGDATWNQPGVFDSGPLGRPAARLRDLGDRYRRLSSPAARLVARSWRPIFRRPRPGRAPLAALRWARWSGWWSGCWWCRNRHGGSGLRCAPPSASWGRSAIWRRAPSSGVSGSRIPATSSPGMVV